MRASRMLGRAPCVESTEVEGIYESQMGPEFAVQVRARAKDRNRCPYCRRRCPRYDAGHGPRRWRTHAIGQVGTTA